MQCITWVTFEKSKKIKVTNAATGNVSCFRCCQALLNQLNIGPNRHKIAKVAIVLALDRHNPQRELISRLISDLYSGLLTQEDIARGFKELLVCLDDIRLDTPDAHTVSTVPTFSALIVWTWALLNK